LSKKSAIIFHDNAAQLIAGILDRKQKRLRKSTLLKPFVSEPLVAA
jgi:hypothetical protein